MEKDTMFMDQKTQYYNLLRFQGYLMGIEGFQQMMVGQLDDHIRK